MPRIPNLKRKLLVSLGTLLVCGVLGELVTRALEPGTTTLEAQSWLPGGGH